LSGTLPLVSLYSTNYKHTFNINKLLYISAQERVGEVTHTWLDILRQISLILMTTLPHFRLSITSPGSAVPAPSQAILDFSRAESSRPARGSYQYDQESGHYNLSWGSLAEFDVWRQEQERADSVDIRLAETSTGLNYSWKRVYRCTRQGTGGVKPYEKKNPNQVRKLGSKRTGCACRVHLKAYPGTNVLLGNYHRKHDHPIHMSNLIFTRVSEQARGKARELLQNGTERSEVVRN
jgi:hypothetical protein